MTNSTDIDVRVKLKPGALIPTYANSDAVGADLYAHLSHKLTLWPGQRQLIPTGVSFELPPNYEVQVRPRSGLALKHGLTVVNAPGTVDPDYRGDISVILLNTGQDAVEIEPGMRIAQAVIAPVHRMRFEAVEQLGETGRGESGFGSTGV